jgi:hypothetical protein
MCIDDPEIEDDLHIIDKQEEDGSPVRTRPGNDIGSENQCGYIEDGLQHKPQQEAKEKVIFFVSADQDKKWKKQFKQHITVHRNILVSDPPATEYFLQIQSGEKELRNSEKKSDHLFNAAVIVIFIVPDRTDIVEPPIDGAFDRKRAFPGPPGNDFEYRIFHERRLKIES